MNANLWPVYILRANVVDVNLVVHFSRGTWVSRTLLEVAAFFASKNTILRRLAGRFADLTIYVVRANYFDKRMLHIPEKIYRENKLQNMALLINASDHSKGAYGYGYGYGYGNEKKDPWYKRGFGSAKAKA